MSSDVPIPDQVATLPGQDISVAQESLITLTCVAQVTNRSFRYTRTQRVSLRLPTVPKHARKVRISVLFEIKPPLDSTVEIC